MDPTSTAYNSRATYNDGSCPAVILGCTDTAASNYRPLANTPDGSCRYVGCTVSSASNYDPSAQIPGMCTGVTSGCTNSAAINYFPDATHDDGSCIFPGCTDSTRSNYSASANFDDGYCAPVFPGCTSPTAANYHSYYTVDDGSCSTSRRRELQTTVYPVLGCTNTAAHNYLTAATQERTPSDCHFLVPGCTIPSSLAATFNYNAAANALSGCQFVFRGCTTVGSPNYAPTANQDDGSCLPAPVYGCADPLANNFNTLATVTRPGDCTYTYSGCGDSRAHNYAADATAHVAGLCIYPVRGCMNPFAQNYMPTATLDDGSCRLFSPPAPPSPPPLPPPSLSPSPSPIPPALWWPEPPALPPSSGIPLANLGISGTSAAQRTDETAESVPAGAIAGIIAGVAGALMLCVFGFFMCDRRPLKEGEKRPWYAVWRPDAKTEADKDTYSDVTSAQPELEDGAPAAADAVVRAVDRYYVESVGGGVGSKYTESVPPVAQSSPRMASDVGAGVGAAGSSTQPVEYAALYDAQPADGAPASANPLADLMGAAVDTTVAEGALSFDLSSPKKASLPSGLPPAGGEKEPSPRVPTPVEPTGTPGEASSSSPVKQSAVELEIVEDRLPRMPSLPPYTSPVSISEATPRVNAPDISDEPPPARSGYVAPADVSDAAAAPAPAAESPRDISDERPTTADSQASQSDVRLSFDI